MGRKKKAPVKPEEDEGFTLEDILGSDAKRSIVAVFLFALSLLFLLAFFGIAGVLGEWLNAGLGMLLGYGKWLFPLVLIAAGVMFLKRRTTTLADAVRFIGLSFGFFALLGLIHLYSGEGTTELLHIAEEGEGGGFIGFGFASLLGSFTGTIAATILLIAFFAIGMIAAFNVSLIHFIEHLQGKLRPKDKGLEDELQPEDGSLPPVPSEESTLIVPPVPDALPTPEVMLADTAESVLEANNIKSIGFPGEEAPAHDEQTGERDEEMVTVPAFVRSRKAARRRSRVHWELPSVDLLESTMGQGMGGDTERNKHIIQSTLRHFGVEVDPGEVRVGPTVTQYTFRPAIGVKLSRITALSNDLALALAAQAIRIEAPIPGQALIGIEVPNKSVATVRLKALMESREFRDRKSSLTLALGQDVSGKHILADLRRMPHVLIAGRTGSGKSICINTFLLSLLYQNSPEDLQLILVDPKRVELSTYRGIPHLKTDVIVDMKKVVNVLRWAVGEMEHRYKVLEEVHARDIVGYRERMMQGEEKMTVDPDTNKVSKEPLQNLPYLVIVIDEVADLMSQYGKEVEAVINRLAAKSRAIGIHLVLATQRPEATVITGLIKANIPTRIAFQLKSQIDSRTILDTGGAEKLLGNGDMLYASSEGSDTKRIQGVFVSDDEIKRVTAFLRKQKAELGEDEIGEDFGGEEETKDDITVAMDALDEGGKQDDMYDRAKDIIVSTGKASTTSLQTALGIGYPRAARLMHLMEENGVVGMVDGKKQVLMAKGETAEATPHVEEEKKYEDQHLSDQKERDKWQL